MTICATGHFWWKGKAIRQQQLLKSTLLLTELHANSTFNFVADCSWHSNIMNTRVFNDLLNLINFTNAGMLVKTFSISSLGITYYCHSSLQSWKNNLCVYIWYGRYTAFFLIHAKAVLTIKYICTYIHIYVCACVYVHSGGTWEKMEHIFRFTNNLFLTKYEISDCRVNRIQVHNIDAYNMHLPLVHCVGFYEHMVVHGCDSTSGQKS